MGLLDTIRRAEREHKAVGHFNIANSDMLKAIAAAAARCGAPSIIGTSEGEREHIGLPQAVALVKTYSLFLNADHTRSVENVRAAAEAGYDMIIFDAAGKPLEENIRLTKEAVAVAKQIKPDVVMEGELGYIGTSSELVDAIPEGAIVDERYMPTPEDARRFVEETGVDALAPAVGNIHGIIKGIGNPKLAIGRIETLHAAVPVPLVLHGGSGIADDDVRAAVAAGMSVVHISSDLRLAWRSGLEAAFRENKEELAPYKLMRGVLAALEELIEKKLGLFGWVVP